MLFYCYSYNVNNASNFPADLNNCRAVEGAHIVLGQGIFLQASVKDFLSIPMIWSKIIDKSSVRLVSASQLYPLFHIDHGQSITLYYMRLILL